MNMPNVNLSSPAARNQVQMDQSQIKGPAIPTSGSNLSGPCNPAKCDPIKQAAASSHAEFKAKHANHPTRGGESTPMGPAKTPNGPAGTQGAVQPGSSQTKASQLKSSGGMPG